MRDHVRAEKQKQTQDIEHMLERTAVLDSAVRAVSLQQMLVPKWSEDRGNYAIMSKLTDAERKKLNDMMFNRYDDLG